MGGRQNIIFILFLVVVVGLAAGWYFYFSTPSASELVTGGAGTVRLPEASSAAVRSGILGSIAAIKEIKLDTTILEEEAFTRLEKVQRPIVPEPERGRDNPFLPYREETVSVPIPSRGR
ncbi:MAG: hypothetical protein A3C84_01020 [Candidatus Ryanbacteria bacterium RIFCSPHIGHO2_02_FULL_48_12]|jgi:hypothetical protein|uniref:Uncharacterized protein n=1 Tax=Candidatus Ryanbacteria bacterium RIFCSPHIGHO2_01_FULL_48_27 TaxID=1802115 RepID=A0A1G2G3Z3_9BACT|nr:MAG: hypothetical protein A2756_03530 [Candidatus Ryanbacteria bacterium RIFCSPHIGHO2_01_FULL_48_27]OGZ50701.1 MAG: hypothetical protein A3C84_01020 [Candidatus Ryanbacteria bacterium RIFCSPHIGHO2_02_FULL_48_12]